MIDSLEESAGAFGPATVAQKSGRLPLADDWNEWRTVPAGAPSLLLALSHHLDLQDAGPVLGPGVNYRVDGIRNGVVALRTVHRDGSTGFGFCNAVDLSCIDRRFRAERPSSSARRGIVDSLSRVGRSLRDRS